MTEPFAKQFPGHRVESGTTCGPHGKIDYSVTTDNNQGFIYYEDGSLLTFNKGTSLELCGTNLTDNKSPAKTIDAANGDIHIRAKNGTIILEAANIRLVGVDGQGGEITIQASKTVHMDAPTLGGQGTNITFAAAQEAHLVGTAAANLAASGKNSCTSGVDTDSSSIMGQIMAAITKFKEFWNSLCA